MADTSANRQKLKIRHKVVSNFNIRYSRQNDRLFKMLLVRNRHVKFIKMASI